MQIKSYLPFKIVLVGVLGFIIFHRSLDAFGVVLIRNISPSLPLGLYYQKNHIHWKKGEILNIELPSELKKKLSGFSSFNIDFPILKTVLGLPGDRICYGKNHLKINGKAVAKIFPELKEMLGSFNTTGCIRLKKSEFLPVNQNYRRSVDGRYFGPIRRKNAKGSITPIWVYKLRRAI